MWKLIRCGNIRVRLHMTSSFLMCCWHCQKNLTTRKLTKVNQTVKIYPSTKIDGQLFLTFLFKSATIFGREELEFKRLIYSKIFPLRIPFFLKASPFKGTLIILRNVILNSLCFCIIRFSAILVVSDRATAGRWFNCQMMPKTSLKWAHMEIGWIRLELLHDDTFFRLFT